MPYIVRVEEAGGFRYLASGSGINIGAPGLRLTKKKYATRYATQAEASLASMSYYSFNRPKKVLYVEE